MYKVICMIIIICFISDHDFPLLLTREITLSAAFLSCIIIILKNDYYCYTILTRNGIFCCYLVLMNLISLQFMYVYRLA